ncbi:MAG: DUF3306 domain-containing protein [Burkholderiaceae bacterium]
MTATDERDDGFLSRWARRKQQVNAGVTVPSHAPAPAAPLQALLPTPDVVVPPGVAPQERPPAPPIPTLADVAALTRESDYSSFVAPGVPGDVRNAAIRKLFTDPHYNLMDGLDTYIDDYGKPDPLPLSMLRQMNQAKFLGLFDDDPDDDDAAGPPPPVATLVPPDTDLASEPQPEPTSDDHDDLQLQQHNAPRRTGADPSAVG